MDRTNHTMNGVMAAIEEHATALKKMDAYDYVIGCANRKVSYMGGDDVTDKRVARNFYDYIEEKVSSWEREVSRIRQAEMDRKACATALSALPVDINVKANLLRLLHDAARPNYRYFEDMINTYTPRDCEFTEYLEY